MPVPGIDSATLTRIGGIDVSDEEAEEDFQFGTGSTSLSRATRVMRCAWADRLALVAYLYSGSSTVAGTPLLVSGQPYPDDANLTVKRVKTKGDGKRSRGANGMVAYERAVLAVTYCPPEFDFGNPALIGTLELESSSSAIAIDQTQSSFKWGDGTKLAPSLTPVMRTTTTSFQLTVYNRPAINYSVILDLIDCVNDAPFYGAAAGRAIFRGARSTRKSVIGAAWNWDVSLAFEVCSAARGSWNNLYRPGVGWRAFTDLGGNPFWTPGNLGRLLA